VVEAQVRQLNLSQKQAATLLQTKQEKYANASQKKQEYKNLLRQQISANLTL